MGACHLTIKGYGILGRYISDPPFKVDVESIENGASVSLETIGGYGILGRHISVLPFTVCVESIELN